MNLVMKFHLEINLFMKQILFIIAILISTSLSAQKTGIPSKPSNEKLVNNFSSQFPNFLTQDEIQLLENKLSNYNDSTSNQICVIIVDDFNGMTSNEFATEIGAKWGVGHEKEDNGIILLIKPTKYNGGRKTEIAVGYGLEGVLPGIVCHKIIEEEINPHFKNNLFYQGINNGTDILMKIASKEINTNTYAKKHKKDSKSTAIIVLLIIALFVYLLSKKGGRGGRGGMTMGPAGFFFMGSGFGSGGGFGGGSSSGGGGFGGFGGGGFGGGGSGGSW